MIMFLFPEFLLQSESSDSSVPSEEEMTQSEKDAMKERIRKKLKRDDTSTAKVDKEPEERKEKKEEKKRMRHNSGKSDDKRSNSKEKKRKSDVVEEERQSGYEDVTHDERVNREQSTQSDEGKCEESNDNLSKL